MFVTFEGVEGGGKSTQCLLLQQWLEAQGRTVLRTREPGGSALGRELRKTLLSRDSAPIAPKAELFLFLADRAQHVEEIIRPALQRGDVVICDRYADSTVVYQGHGRGLDPAELHNLNHTAISGLWPDLTILLDLPADVGLRRAIQRNVAEGTAASEGRFEAEQLDFHQRIRAGYLTRAQAYPERFCVVDALQTPETVAAIVRQAVADRMP